jgi:DUF1365 family protein
VSAVYEGAIRHRRFAEHPTEFRHPLAMLYVDLDELPGLLGGLLVRRRPGLVRIRRRDLLGPRDVPLGDAVRDAVERELGERPDGPVRLLAQPRSLGLSFNPVAFYFCFGADEQLRALVAEVTSTPWRERHAYVLPAGPSGVDARVGKALHVSPFMDMAQTYRVRADAPGATVRVDIESSGTGGRAFDATLSLRRRDLTRAALRSRAVPVLRTLALIYGHAAGLWLRGVAVRPHPAREARR